MNGITKECGSCTHFTKSPRDVSGKTGQCRRYPPNAFPMADKHGNVNFMTDFTPVSKEWVCGEWQKLIDLSSVVYPISGGQPT